MPNINTRFTLSGEKEYKQALSEIGNGMRVLDSEMRKVQSAYAKNADSVESLAAQNDVLERKILSQTEKIEYLKAALQQSAEKYGESDKRTMQWQTSLNNAEAELNNLNNKLDENKGKIEESGKEAGNLGDVGGGLTEKFRIKLPEGMQKSINSMGSLNTTSVKIAGGFVALAVAIAKAEKALIQMTRESAEAADDIVTLSSVTGMSTDSIQELNYMADLTDVSLDRIRDSLKETTNKMQEAATGTGDAYEAYNKLGVKITDVDGQLRSAEDVFYDTIDALGQMKNKTERDAIAMDILSESAQELNPLIEIGSDGLKQYAQEAHSMGYVLDNEALTALTEVDDAYQRLQKSQEGAKNQLSAEFAPYLTEFYEKITKLIRDGGQALKDSGLVDSFGMLLETVGDIIAPTDQLSSDTVPKLTEALRPLAEIMAGAKVLAKKYKSYALKMDPNVRKDDEEFVQIMQSLGGSFKFDGSDFSSSLQPSVVYILDIAGRTPDEMFMHFPYKTRYAIRSAAKFGVEVRECGRESLPEFYEIMQETCERDHFSVRPLSYFERMYDEMGDHLKLYLSYYEGKAISGAINITYGNRSLHLYGASSNSHRDKMPNYAMQWKMISTAAANGIRLYDFGGIAAVEDESSPLYGLYVFKRKFRGEVVEYVGEIEVVFRPAVNKLLGFAYNLRRKILRGPGRKKK